MKITLNENEYSLDHIGLKKWIELENIKEDILKAAENRNIDDTVSSICSYVSAVFDVPNLLELSWYEVANAYVVISSFCVPRLDLAILKPSVREEERKVSWDYDERTWYQWSHIFAKMYGWTLEYTENIDFNDGLALMQEVLVEEQMAKEWQWSLTEIAYPYNESTKKSEFHPLKRPSWMKEEMTVSPVKKTKILISMMPVGNVIRLGAEQNEASTN